jgi:hypothetical protein
MLVSELDISAGHASRARLELGGGWVFATWWVIGGPCEGGRKGT